MINQYSIRHDKSILLNSAWSLTVAEMTSSVTEMIVNHNYDYFRVVHRYCFCFKIIYCSFLLLPVLNFQKHYHCLSSPSNANASSSHGKSSPSRQIISVTHMFSSNKIYNSTSMIELWSKMDKQTLYLFNTTLDFVSCSDGLC